MQNAASANHIGRVLKSLMEKRVREKLNFSTPRECFYEKISYICTCNLNPRKLINNQIEKAV